MSERKTAGSNDQPDMELAITVPLPGSVQVEARSVSVESLSMITSLVAPSDADQDHDQMILGVVDTLGSAVAEATGWQPPEQEDR